MNKLDETKQERLQRLLVEEEKVLSKRYIPKLKIDTRLKAGNRFCSGTVEMRGLSSPYLHKQSQSH